MIKPRPTSTMQQHKSKAAAGYQPRAGLHDKLTVNSSTISIQQVASVAAKNGDSTDQTQPPNEVGGGVTASQKQLVKAEGGVGNNVTRNASKERDQRVLQ